MAEFLAQCVHAAAEYNSTFLNEVAHIQAFTLFIYWEIHPSHAKNAMKWKWCCIQVERCDISTLAHYLLIETNI